MKKFLMISTIMLLVTSVFLIVSKTIIGDEKYAIDRLFKETEKRQEFSFLKYEETDRGREIRISIKNNWKKIIDIRDLKLTFAKKDGGNIDLPIYGQEYFDYSNGYFESKYGIDPGETREFVFLIPKEVSFDETVDLNKMSVMGQMTDYAFRVGSSTLYGGFGSWTARAELINTGEPITFK